MFGIRAFEVSLCALALLSVDSKYCRTTVVGGGPGGVYFAWRLSASNPSKAHDTCIFERSERVGGRIYTLRGLGPHSDLTVEMGAYRFNDAPMVEQESDNKSEFVYTPLTAAVIKNALGLPVAEYEPGNANSTMLKIVDRQGFNAGYHTFVEQLANVTISRGVQMIYSATLHSIAPLANGDFLIFFEDGRRVQTSALLLNLPQLPLLRILQQSGPLLQADGYPDVLQAPLPVDGAKLYVHYRDAWWRNYLNLTHGQFSASGALKKMHPLQGRYHDGDVRCSNGWCRGFLEVAYVYSDDARFFLPQQLSSDPPYSLLHASDAAGAFFLEKMHAALCAYHEAALRRAGVLEKVTALRPDFALLSYWGAQTVGFGAAVHSTKEDGRSTDMLAAESMAPFPSKRFYVANEGFGSLRGPDASLSSKHGWAECSLVMAENILTSHFGLSRPDWIDSGTYERWVRYPKQVSRILV
eukprot:TRINITY_DN15908_c0_g1_i1.p1 TRINITY_DN15908_c0_g1~~TRINITY_DN15908_c0_g1_i1.p1  ORF type:complete len:468 (-),score=45.50 TRINITY_DN15908_c0_g1_i1:57-1460(-)